MSDRPDVLRRARAGLWLTGCGRFTLRRLGDGSWAVSTVHHSLRSGEFSRRAAGQLLPQRFATRQQAQQALAVQVELASSGSRPVALAWQRTAEGYRTQHDGYRLGIERSGRLWRAWAMPEQMAQMAEELQAKDTPRSLQEMMLGRITVELGTARTLAAAQHLAAQELACGLPTLGW